ncbi:MAG: endo-1,4-beta-xylanase, partial [Armatimonadetes bacterium]|nr:endo-1,4-beta-xylanase [Armatimonadota bacterium]
VIQPERGRFDWTAADKFLDTARANGMEVSGLLLYNLPWSRAGDVHLPVDVLDDWAAYVTAVAGHSRGQVKYWEVWNETPNFIGKGTAADYAATVVRAHDAAKAADPACRVGLSIQSNNVNWIEQVLKAGAKSHYDYIAVHPYEILGMVEQYGCDAVYLSIVPTLRKMLAAQDPARADVPIWVTEVGCDARDGEPVQAISLVKAFVLALAQGVARVDWFEGKDGDSGPMGLLRADRTPRMAYGTVARLTQQLGPAPRYLGWVQFGEGAHGFVFQGADGPVMAAWARPGTSAHLSLGAAAQIVDPLTGGVSTADGCTLTGAPVLVVGVPEALLATARANHDRPVPWGGDYRGATSVYLAAGHPTVERGLHLLGNAPTVEVGGVPALDCGLSAGQAFAVDPGFLSYDTRPITITAVVRRNAAGDNAGFNLWYESTSGIKGTGAWFTIPEVQGWQTQTWTITDAQFVGKWAYNFLFNADTPRPYFLRSLTVTMARDSTEIAPH